MGGPAPAHSQWQGDDHCSFHQVDRPQLTAVTDPAKLLLIDAGETALLPGSLLLPQGVVGHLQWLVDTGGYRPPPLLPTGPARAPPFR